MIKQLLCSLHKDVKEYIRCKKHFILGSVLLTLCIMVFGATNFLPSLINELIKNAAYIVSDIDSIKGTITTFFPRELAANMGILVSDIFVFYGIVVILSTYNLIPKEIAEGRWIFPLSVGYDPFILILSKGLVYSMGAAVPCVVVYNLYYCIGNIYLYPDYVLTTSMINSIVLGISIFFIAYFTTILSSIYKHAIMSACTMIMFVVIAPDIFTLFSFGKYLPTYMLTHLNQSSNNFQDLIIPVILTIIMAILLTSLAAQKASNIEVSR